MKKQICYSLAFLFVLIFSAAINAYTTGEMESSPLFKASLNKSIAQLEGKMLQPPVYADANGNVLATTGSGCAAPNRPYTQISTCSPSFCGSPATCLTTCGQNTCQSTCSSTCANTCANTCVGGSCSRYRFAGTSYWVYGSSYSNNWSQSPYPCYQSNPGGVFCQFDDEGFPGTSISAVNYYNGTYSGYRTRVTTSDGAYVAHAVILSYPQGPSQVAGWVYWYGPINSSSVNYANIFVYE